MAWLQRSPWLIPALAACIALAVLIARTALTGIGATDDSRSYLEAAQSLVSEGRYAAWTSAPYVHWPPLYPSLLAGLMALGAGPAAAAWALNAVAVAGIAGLTAHLARLLLSGAGLAVLAAVAAGLSVPVQQAASMAWSEPLFILFSLAAVTLMAHYLRRPTWGLLAAFSVCAALALLQRYLGVSVVGVGMLAIVAAPPVHLRRWAAHGAVLAGVALAPLAAWLARSATVASAAVGERVGADDPLPVHLYRLVRAVISWYLPLPRAGEVAVVGLVTAGAVAGLVLLVAWPPRRWRAIPVGSVLSSAGALVTLYAGALLITASLVKYDDINTRLASPLAPGILLLVLAAVQRATRAGIAAGPRARLALTAGAVLLLCAFPAWHQIAVLSGAEQPPGPRRWLSGPAVLTGMGEVATGADVVTNDPSLLYYQTGLRALPTWEAASASTLACADGAKPAVIVWFGPEAASAAGEWARASAPRCAWRQAGAHPDGALLVTP